jgi:hypothetical protein
MRKVRFVLTLALALTLIAGFAFAPSIKRVEAQETSLTTCDSTLMLLVLMAQQGFGYTPTSTSIDLSTFERGQFRGYFDEMSMAMGTDQTGQQGAQGSDQNQSGQTSGDQSGQTGSTDQSGQTSGDQSGQTGSTDQSGQTSGDQTGMMNLMSGSVANEDPNCALLRSDVETFLSTQLQGGWRINRATMGGAAGETGSQGAESGSSGG